MNGRQPEEMENEMGQNIFVGILCVLALGAVSHSPVLWLLI